MAEQKFQRGGGMSRRGFLQAASAVAAFGIARSAHAQANDTLNIGIIGCRNRGHQVAEVFMGQPDARVVALADCDSAMIERAMEHIGDKFEQQPKIEKDFRRLIEDPDIDAIVVATPDHWHAQMAKMGFEAGKHVYLEKPATYCIDEGKVLVAAQEENPNLLMHVGTQHRSGPHFLEARQFVQEGNLGKVGFVRCWITHDRGKVPVVPNTEPPASLDYDLWTGPAPMRPYNPELTHYNWHWTRANGTGEMGNWGAHWLDTARMLLDLDLPHAVYGHGGDYVVDDAKEWPDTMTVVYEYPELSMLWEQRLWTRYGVNRMGGGVEIDGDKGSLVIDRGGWVFFPKDGEPVEHDGQQQEHSHVRNFIDAVKGDAKSNAPIEVGHKSAVACHLGNISVLMNRRLKFDPQAQRFEDAEANEMLMRDYRDPWSLA